MDISNSYVLAISILFLIIFMISSDALLFTCHRNAIMLSL